MAKSPENKLNSLKDSYSALSGLDNPNNPIVKTYQRQIFNELLSLENLDNIDQEDLVKSTLTKVILDHLAISYADVDYETLKKDSLFTDFKSHLNDIDSEYNKAADPEAYFKSIYLEKTVTTNGIEYVIWLHPNFSSGNDTNANESVDFNELYSSEELTNSEVKLFLNYLSNTDKAKDITTENNENKKLSINERFNRHFGIKGKIYDYFKSSKSIKSLTNYDDFLELVEEVKQKVNTTADELVFKKFQAIHEEHLNQEFAQLVWTKAKEHPLIKQNLNEIVTSVRDISSLDEFKLAELLTSKDKLRGLCNLSNDQFNELYDDLKSSIELAYQEDKSKEISYLYEQFVLHENKKILGVTYIAHETQSLVSDLLTVKEEAPEFGISVGDLQKLNEEAQLYPERLNQNFRNGISRDKVEMKRLRSSRMNVAKLRAYNAALDLELTNEELASGDADSKIKELVFERAISSDLDDLFLNYQDGSKNKIRKKYNQATSWFGSKLAGMSALAGIAIPVGFKSFTKATTAFAAGPMAAVGLGALFMKPASRRLLNWDKARLHVSKDEKQYDEVALNFSEAARDMTGNRNDSLFSESDEIENKYILEQKKQLKSFSENISEKVDGVIRSDRNISTLRRSLKRSIVENSDPKNINEIALRLKKAITKKITEFYIDEYKKVLSSIEDKRKYYALRVATEYATAFAMTLGVSSAVGWALESLDIIDSAEAAEKSSNNDTNPKGGNDPTASKSDADSSTKKIDKTDALKSKEDLPISKSKTEVTIPTEIDKISNQIQKVGGSLFDGLFGNTQPQEYTFKVPTNAELVGTTDKDPGLVQLIRSWSDNKLSIKEALEAAKMMDLKDINLIRDGEQLKFSQEVVEYISDKSKISSKDLLNRDITEQFIKYNKA